MAKVLVVETRSRPPPEIAHGRGADADGERNTPPAPEATSFRAELYQRGNGQWVIARIAPAREPLGDQSVSASSDTHVAMLLSDYRRAFAAGDIDALERVWLMSPAERVEIEQAFEKVPGFDVQLDNALVDIRGDRASLTFNQVLRKRSTPAAMAPHGTKHRLGAGRY